MSADDRHPGLLLFCLRYGLVLDRTPQHVEQCWTDLGHPLPAGQTRRGAFRSVQAYLLIVSVCLSHHVMKCKLVLRRIIFQMNNVHDV